MNDSKKKITLVCGARPNFMKVGPLFHALQATNWAVPELLHTGQHYSADLSGTFFEDLKLPPPTVNLEVGSGGHGEQTGKVMVAFEQYCLTTKPDAVVVVGDVNSTVAGALVAVKLGIPTVHLEAGLRSYDRSMPEEINRIVTDSICDLLLTPSIDADENLIKEGIARSKIHCVGNIMIDALLTILPEAICPRIPGIDHVTTGKFGVVTLHRPSNVDSPVRLKELLATLVQISSHVPLLLPIHPRTLGRIKQFGMDVVLNDSAVYIIPPQRYKDFIGLVKSAHLVITDSGGIQEETSYLQIPCFTLRDNTERPVTVTLGTNRLVTPLGLPDAIEAELRSPRQSSPIPLWDGKTAARCLGVLESFLA